MCYIGNIGIAIADVDRLCVWKLGHDILSKMFVEGRNGAVICSGIGGVDRLSVSRAEESGVVWLVVWQCLSSIQPPSPGMIHD